MIAAFGPSKKPNIQMSTKDNVFLKLGRSLSVDYKHKYKASKNSDASQEQFKQPYPYQLDQIEESEGYTSDKNTDAASIDLLDRTTSLMIQRFKHRRRKRNRRLNRMKK